MCRYKLDQTLYRLRDKWPESHQQQDMSGIGVKCGSCGVRTLLKDISFEIDTAMTRFFIMLACADPKEWDEDFVPTIQQVIGCETRIVMERM